MIEINGIPHEKFFKFPAGEIHVGLTEQIQHTVNTHVFANIKTSDDIMELLLVCNALRHHGVKNIDLTIPYVPYARQDRVCADGESFSIQVMTDLINSIGASRVSIFDPHSDVTSALIKNVNVIEQHKLMPLSLLSEKTLVCPDAGAEKKILKLGQSYIMCSKIRDPKTGNIKETVVDTRGYPITGRDLLIVDDICDGGRTFIEIAKVLREHKPKSIELYVTHGIFSKGLQVFENYLDKVHYLDYRTAGIITKVIG